MPLSKNNFLCGFLGAFLLAIAADALAAERERDRCRRGDRLKIQDLDVYPDPVIEGQRIRAWKVRIRLDGNRECDAEIEIRERRGNEVVGRERRRTLRPGSNEFDIRAVDGYRFQGGS